MSLDWLPNGENPEIGDILYIEEDVLQEGNGDLYLVMGAFPPAPHANTDRTRFLCIWLRVTSDKDKLKEVEQKFRNFKRWNFQRREETEKDYVARLSDILQSCETLNIFDSGIVWNWEIMSGERGTYKGKAKCFFHSETFPLPALPEL